MKVLIIADNKVLRDYAKMFDANVVESKDMDLSHGIWDVIISLHCTKIIPKHVTDNVRCYNLHPGIFPHGRGVMPYIFAIMYDEIAGCTFHRMTEKLDRGYIVDQKIVDILPNDTGETLHQRILEEEKQMLFNNYHKIVNNEYEAIPDPVGGVARKMKDFKELCEIKDTQTIKQLRALEKSDYDNAYCGDTYIHIKLK